jgi:F0F1-type ATP synthase assembly protein I
MSTAADKSDKKDVPSQSTVVLLFMIAADTTWRMFVPIIGGTLLGLWVDRSVHHIWPVGTIIGIAVGVGVATYLVRRQLQQPVKKDNK